QEHQQLAAGGQCGRGGLGGHAAGSFLGRSPIDNATLTTRAAVAPPSAERSPHAVQAAPKASEHTKRAAACPVWTSARPLDRSAAGTEPAAAAISTPSVAA